MTDASGGESGRAFHALLAVMRDADETFLDGPRAGMDALGVAEGYRHLTHLLAYALDLYLEGDPERPVFTPLASPTQKILGDNVDSLYHFAPLRGDRRYRITGTRGNEVYLAFCVYGGKPDGKWSERVVANLSQRDLACGPDGSFEIILTGEPMPRPVLAAEPHARPSLPLHQAATGNVITLAPDAVCVIVRQYFVDRTDVRPASFTIAPIDPVAPPPALDDATLAHRLRAVATFVRETIQFAPLPAGLPPNVLGPPMPWSPHVPGWGTPDNIYSLGLFRMEPDEALVIAGRSPRCVYFGAQLWNRYMQSLDYRHHRVSLNHREIAFEPDGSFRLVVARRDPGMPNWLDTAGHCEGVVFCRWLQSDALPEPPTSRVVRIAT